MVQKFGLIIRRANADDADLLAELGARTFSETFASENAPEDMAAYLASSFNSARQASEIADASSTFFIAEVDGVAAGYAKLQDSEPPADVRAAKPVELVRLYVSEEWLGRGVGEVLMRACVEEARRTGHEAIWLGVWERNGRAQAFYRKWGFREVGEHVFRLGSDRQTDILMERAI